MSGRRSTKRASYTALLTTLQAIWKLDTDSSTTDVRAVVTLVAALSKRHDLLRCIAVRTGWALRDVYVIFSEERKQCKEV